MSISATVPHSFPIIGVDHQVCIILHHQLCSSFIVTSRGINCFPSIVIDNKVSIILKCSTPNYVSVVCTRVPNRSPWERVSAIDDQISISLHRQPDSAVFRVKTLSRSQEDTPGISSVGTSIPRAYRAARAGKTLKQSVEVLVESLLKRIENNQNFGRIGSW